MNTRKTCQRCKFLTGICTVYNKEPPSSRAERCQHYIEKVAEIAEETPAQKDCLGCDKYYEGYCMRNDHPGFQFNFVKIKDSTKCPV